MKALSLLALSLIFVYQSFALAQKCSDVLEPVKASNFRAKDSWFQQTITTELDHLAEFFKSIKDLSDDEKIKLVMDKGLRVSFFKLQGIFRVLEEKNMDFFDDEKTFFKSLEDSLGQLDLATSLKDTAIDVKENQMVEYFAKEESKRIRDSLKLLYKSGLLKDPTRTVAKWKNKLNRKGDWSSGKKDRKFIADTVAEYASDLNDKVKDDDFDKAKIEKGLHELRRRLRWIIIKVMAFDGLVKLQDEPRLRNKVKTWYDEMEAQDSKMLTNKFIVPSTVIVDDPILVPKHEFAMISELVTQIGLLKDKAEKQIYFSEAMDELDLSKKDRKRIEDKLADKLGTQKQIDHRALSVEIQRRLSETNVLRDFSDDIQNMNHH